MTYKAKKLGKKGKAEEGDRERERICNRTLGKIRGKKSGEKRRGTKKVMRKEDGQSLGKRLELHHDRNKGDRKG